MELEGNAEESVRQLVIACNTAYLIEGWRGNGLWFITTLE
jgi:hypothetical protein